MSKADFNEYMIQAKSLLGAEKYEEALTYLDKAEKEENMDEELYLTRGIVLANLSRFDEAKAEFEKVLKLKKDNGLALFHMGNIEILIGNRAQGIEYFNNAIAYGFDDAQVYYSLGLMHEEDGNDELALRNYSKAILKDPTRADIRIRKVRTLVNNKMEKEALFALDELILSNPDAFEGYHMKYLLLVDQKKYDDAAKVIEEAMTLFPKDTEFALDKASLMVAKGDLDAALAYIDQIKEEMETTPEILHGMEMQKSRIYSAKEDMGKVVEHLESARQIALENNVNDFEESYLLMNCYVSQKAYEKAIEAAKHLKEAEGQDYYSLAAHYYEPYALKQMGKTEGVDQMFNDAIDYYRSVTLENPSNVDAYAFRIMCLREINKFDKALELTDYLVTVADQLPETHALRAAILNDLGRTKEAEEENNKYLSIQANL
ncbi:Flp pilus assembly protein TadD, contains TPR repeats [Pseudobutyrivibrio sp. 49]|uniref:tetratricopeptide repeat protein n=1 Tax=unclassified Pseudobutyrivibrio TaxID=2638619 RepID=UPI0008927C35|nr:MULTISPECIES: tetratricopeptide repeat protein [unclassified Pseudobutyrivibrio]SDI36103.1 Flp pilus assembly protein TadD, contains TPR repeats [Pseudobutyrivibrio sp. 49]SFN94753.1 Flp pilus assembly protein TadD, contains TPR repeats [Pseudobutyrivibrio sp. UC1225]